PAVADGKIERPPVLPKHAPEFVQKLTAEIIAGGCDRLPVSAMSVDGTFPTGTTPWEERNIQLKSPGRVTDLGIPSGKCVNACPQPGTRAIVSSSDPPAVRRRMFKAD